MSVNSVDREASATNAKSPTGIRHVVVTASSAGGLQALSAILSRLPRDFPAAVLVVQHRAPHPPYLLSQILAKRTTLKVKDAKEGDEIRNGTVYVAIPESHLVVRPDRTLAYADHQRIRFLRSAANPLLESASKVFGRDLVAVVLTGGDSDATDGVQSVRKRGGVVIAQDAATSQVYDMPHSAINTGCVDYVLPLDKIALTLRSLVGDGGSPLPHLSS